MPVLQTAFSSEALAPKSFWLLNNNTSGYKNIGSDELSTEAKSGRKFQIIYNPNFNSSSLIAKRIKVRLLEDGYICWFELQDILNQIKSTNSWEPILLTKTQINAKLSNVLTWIEKASLFQNYYLWGGTIGPNFDCSGLIQAAFSSENIWLPRDAYQQEQFCTKIDIKLNNLKKLRIGDLLFFGTKQKCTHVGIYKGEGLYWHSSGILNGRNGIGIDNLKQINNNPISSYYASILRGAGRVENCHNGTF